MKKYFDRKQGSGKEHQVGNVDTDECLCQTSFREKGIKSYAAHLEGKNTYDKEDYRSGTALLIGNEGNGLSDEIAECADCYLKIPMEGKVESLNAAVSAALLMYECKRQRGEHNENMV